MSLRIPQTLRRAVPERVRDDVRLRAVAMGAGLIPPRTMCSPDEIALLQALARPARHVVEIGVYEGSSALALCEAMSSDSELVLVDPFERDAAGLNSGWAASAWATRRVVARACRHGGPRVTWHVERSQDLGRRWSREVEVVFIDGDHSPDAVREDWALWHRHVVPGGHVVFHDARGERGLPGPRSLVEELFRSPDALDDWTIAAEVDRAVAVRRAGASGATS